MYVEPVRMCHITREVVANNPAEEKLRCKQWCTPKWGWVWLDAKTSAPIIALTHS